ncbi:MAG TPA: CoA transferase [Candidatus Polarisedimenticolaceae bacterium]|nr:CoA transferase [Candidatus Polarisedimenticolaceae bacterium]
MRALQAVLRGIEVVSLAVNVPGPVAAARLAEHGATVLKVEPPEGDPLSLHVPSWYARLTESQTVVRLDLKSGEGMQALAARLSGADLLLTAHRPRTLARLGLDFASLHPRFPRLCQLQILGFAAPDEDLPGHDLSFQAAAGLVVDPPRMPFTLLADLVGAERAVGEAMAMLFHRERTGEVTCRQVALADAAAALAPPVALGLCRTEGPLGGAHPGYALYAAADGWVALAALEPRFLQTLGEALGLAPVTADRLRAVFPTRTAADWEAWGRQHGVPLTRVR